MENKFDHIRSHIMEMVEQKRCPEFAKDALLDIIATEKSLIRHAQIVAVMIMCCSDYAEFLEHMYNRMQTDLLIFTLTGRLPSGKTMEEVLDEDPDEDPDTEE